jgi:hypothetical protein
MTYEKYGTFSRLHIIPHLGGKRLDKIQVKDIRQWLNKLTVICQCCAQGKDAARPEHKRRCCAVGGTATRHFPRAAARTHATRPALHSPAL